MKTWPVPKSRIALPGLIVAAVALAVAAFNGCKGPDLLDVIGTMNKKLEIVSLMRVDLLKSADAEKSAVMADTDEASRSFADTSRDKARAVDREREELARLIEKDHTTDELASFREFDNCWAECKKIDQEILDFAVQNTNIKAAQLSFGKGKEAVERFEKALRAVIAESSSSDRCGEIAGLASDALAAGMTVQFLHAPHIITESDRRMADIEREIGQYDETVATALKRLAGLVPGSSAHFVAEADSAFKDHLAITREVVGLSRQNSNIKSFGLSLGRKRAIAAQCDGVLSSLHEIIESRAFKATR